MAVLRTYASPALSSRSRGIRACSRVNASCATSSGSSAPRRPARRVTMTKWVAKRSSKLPVTSDGRSVLASWAVFTHTRRPSGAAVPRAPRDCPSGPLAPAVSPSTAPGPSTAERSVAAPPPRGSSGRMLDAGSSGTEADCTTIRRSSGIIVDCKRALDTDCVQATSAPAGLHRGRRLARNPPAHMIGQHLRQSAVPPLVSAFWCSGCQRRLTVEQLSTVGAAVPTDALRDAQATRGRMADAIFHANHGAQDTSRSYAEFCTQFGVVQSMSAVGSTARPLRKGLHPCVVRGQERIDGGALALHAERVHGVTERLQGLVGTAGGGVGVSEDSP